MCWAVYSTAPGTPANHEIPIKGNGWWGRGSQPEPGEQPPHRTTMLRPAVLALLGLALAAAQNRMEKKIARNIRKWNDDVVCWVRLEHSLKGS